MDVRHEDDQRVIRDLDKRLKQYEAKYGEIQPVREGESVYIGRNITRGSLPPGKAMTREDQLRHRRRRSLAASALIHFGLSLGPREPKRPATPESAILAAQIIVEKAVKQRGGHNGPAAGGRRVSGWWHRRGPRFR
jgi:hypothetical protein